VESSISLFLFYFILFYFILFLFLFLFIFIFIFIFILFYLFNFRIKIRFFRSGHQISLASGLHSTNLLYWLNNKVFKVLESLPSIQFLALLVFH